MLNITHLLARHRGDSLGCGTGYSLLGLRNREGRDEHVRRTEAMDRAIRDVRLAAEQVEARRAGLGDLERAQARRLAFDASEGWREAKAAEVSQALSQHWAQAILAVARQGDPLAFGTERLREARVTLAADLDRLGADLPPDAGDRVRRSQAELARAERNRSNAVSRMEEAEHDLALASQRRWGRIDKPARDEALLRRAWARSSLEGADVTMQRAQDHLRQARADQSQREQALAATADRRQELSQAVTDLDEALERSRPERVLALARQEITPAHLVEALGALPEGPGRRAVWCALAEEVERFRDRHPGREADEEVDRWRHPDLHADQARLHDLLARAPELVVAGDQLSVDVGPLGELSAHGWAVQLGQAEALVPRVPEPALEQGLGMDLGW